MIGLGGWFFRADGREGGEPRDSPPSLLCIGKFLPYSRNHEGMIGGVLCDYSTVTDFARFLGLSTSQPRPTAM